MTPPPAPPAAPTAILTPVLDALRAWLARRPLDAAAVDYVESTCGREALARLPQLLAGDDGDTGCEGEVLRELVLFPDLELALVLEPLLAAAEAAGAGGKDAAWALARKLAGADVTVLLPDGQALALTLAADEARRLVQRLHVSRTVPEELRAVLREVLEAVPAGGNDSARLAVSLRRARLDWQPVCIEAVQRLVRGSGGLDPARLALLLEWFLGFLGESSAETDLAYLRLALHRRYARIQELLGRAATLQKLRASQSMEVLASQGLRAGHLDAAALAEELVLAEQAARAVWDEVLAFAVAPARELDLGGFDGSDVVDDLAELMRRLEG